MPTAKQSGRPRDPIDLAPLIERHHGSMSAIAEELGISRQAVADRLRTRGLLKKSARAKDAAGIGAPGAEVVLTDGERAKVLRALAATKTLTAAAARLGWNRMRLSRRIQAYGISGREIAKQRSLATRA